MKQHPKISVLVPTYNQMHFIGECLDSVFSQKTNFPIEILVGNDCSTDSTAKVIESYIEKVPLNFNFYQYNWEKNEGGLLNINKLLKKAKGEFVIILEGDDYWIHENFLQKAIDYLSQHSNASLFTGQVLAKRKNNLIFKMPGKRLRHTSVSIESMLLGNFISLGSTVFRKQDCPSILDEWLQLPLGDWPLFIRLLNKGKGYFFRESCMVYRLSETGIWSDLTKQKKILGTLITANAVVKTLPLDLNHQKLLKTYIKFLKLSLILETYQKRAKRNLREKRELYFLFRLIRILLYKNLLIKIYLLKKAHSYVLR
jgi:glycosyltransferase involved in cell wall biosynthesis